jgi:flagellar hook-basal body complex protein FliE
MVSPLLATKAYSAVQDLSGPADKSKMISGSDSFSQLLNNAINDAVATSKNAETQMSNQIQGKASLVDVATAISSAQTSLQTVMAVRDQVISAYQEIMRMTI